MTKQEIILFNALKDIIDYYKGDYCYAKNVALEAMILYNKEVEHEKCTVA